QLTTQAIGALLHTGVDTTFISIYGKLKGRLAAIESKNVPLRLRQFECLRNPGFCLETARTIVGAKINNSRKVLKYYQRKSPNDDLGRIIKSLWDFQPRLLSAVTLDGIRGIEGHAAAGYFPAFKHLLRHGIAYDHRTRRPPRDPVNAALSFGYAMLLNEAVAG